MQSAERDGLFQRLRSELHSMKGACLSAESCKYRGSKLVASFRTSVKILKLRERNSGCRVLSESVLKLLPRL